MTSVVTRLSTPMTRAMVLRPSCPVPRSIPQKNYMVHLSDGVVVRLSDPYVGRGGGGGGWGGRKDKGKRSKRGRKSRWDERTGSTWICRHHRDAERVPRIRHVSARLHRDVLLAAAIMNQDLRCIRVTQRAVFGTGAALAWGRRSQPRTVRGCIRGRTRSLSIDVYETESQKGKGHVTPACPPRRGSYRGPTK